VFWVRSIRGEIAVQQQVHFEELAMKQVMKFINDEAGLTTVEYAIAGGLVGAAVVASFKLLGTTVNGIIQGIIGHLGGGPAAP
jgi:pilus assembly protein Flp/PilA